MKDVTRPWVLGFSTRHNGAAALLHGDEIFVAIQEERLLRMKRAEHPVAFPSLAMRYCLSAAGIGVEDLSAVAVCGFSLDDPAEDVSANPFLQTAVNDILVFRAPHHLAHAYGAFYMSGFPDSNILVIDGHGGNLTTITAEELSCVLPSQRKKYSMFPASEVYETISLYFSDHNTVVPLAKHISIVSDSRPKIGMPFFHTLGKMYASAGAQIFGDYQTWGIDAAGKVMGLAPFGHTTIPIDDFYSIEGDDFVFHDTVPLTFCHYEHWPNHQEEYANLAASAQAAIEAAVLFVAGKLRQYSQSSRLCYAGGVALNGVANERLIREGCFSSVFVMPAAEDSGTAIGAAFYALEQLRIRRAPKKRTAADSVGRKYSPHEISAAIAITPAIYGTDVDVISHAAELLASGQILGWFQGGSELGPRALGQRSILADPRSAEMKDKLNSQIKFREAFRPYAPAVLLEYAPQWFHLSAGAESPFMLRVIPFAPEKRTEVPAVVHVDGTGRVQTITPNANHRLFHLINIFREKTGIPLLLNTSLNVAGEPIAESPEDALWYLLSTGLNACVLEDRLIIKEPTFQSIFDYLPILQNATISERNSDTRRWRSSRQGTFWCISGPVGLVNIICSRASLYARKYICVVVETPLGSIVHAMPMKWKNALEMMDARHTGWEILEHLRQTDRYCTQRSLLQLLGRLRFGSGFVLGTPGSLNTRGSKARI